MLGNINCTQLNRGYGTRVEFNRLATATIDAANEADTQLPQVDGDHEESNT